MQTKVLFLTTLGALALSACAFDDDTVTKKTARLKADLTVHNNNKRISAQQLAYLHQRLSVDQNGKLQLGQPDFQGSSDGQSGYDAGMSAYKQGHIDNAAFSKVRGDDSPDGAISVYLRDPAATGWQHQTFGQIIDNRHYQSAGYVNVGHVMTPDKDANIKADYRGIAMGTLGNHSEVIARYRHILQQQPDLVFVELALAQALFADQQFREAEHHFRRLPLAQLLPPTQAQVAAYLQAIRQREVGAAQRRFAQAHFFSGFPRQDTLLENRLSLWQPQWHFKGITPKLHWHYRRTRSNVPELYDHQRQQWHISVDKPF